MEMDWLEMIEWYRQAEEVYASELKFQAQIAGAKVNI